MSTSRPARPYAPGRRAVVLVGLVAILVGIAGCGLIIKPRTYPHVKKPEEDRIATPTTVDPFEVTIATSTTVPGDERPATTEPPPTPRIENNLCKHLREVDRVAAPISDRDAGVKVWGEAMAQTAAAISRLADVVPDEFEARVRGLVIPVRDLATGMRLARDTNEAFGLLRNAELQHSDVLTIIVPTLRRQCPGSIRA